MVAPAVAGFLLDRAGSFFWPFLIEASVIWLGALTWIVVVPPIEPVQWDAQSLPEELEVRLAK